MRGECPQCHRPPDFTNVGTCPNCGRFDWVLVPYVHGQSLSEDGKAIVQVLDNAGKLLWACPCGEFKWTSYADWGKAEKAFRYANGDEAAQP